MTGPSVPEMEAERERLYAQLSAVGDFRRGSVTENCRRCGKPGCACAQPDHPGHGPRFLWTRTIRGQKKRGRQLAIGEVESRIASIEVRSGGGTWTIVAVLIGLLAVAVYVLVVGWSSAGDASTDISVVGYIAMALGIVFALILGIGLMALIFYSNRHR